jgi:hypothetical protein
MTDENNDLLMRIQQYQETTSDILKRKDEEIQALSEVLVKLTARLEEFEDAKPRPTGEPGMGVI